MEYVKKVQEINSMDREVIELLEHNPSQDAILFLKKFSRINWPVGNEIEVNSSLKEVKKHLDVARRLASNTSLF